MIVKVILAVIFLFYFLMLLFILFPMIEIVGDSMFPTYKNGETLFGTRLYRKSHLKVGDVILYQMNEEEDTRIVVKRIKHIRKHNGELQFFCVGDNSKNSYDSRYYGYVSENQLVCKLINQRSVKRDESYFV